MKKIIYFLIFMTMKKNKLIILLTFSLLGFNAWGQLSTKEMPVSFSFEKAVELSDEQSIKYLPAIDRDAIQKEDEEREVKGAPPRFGYKHKVNYNSCYALMAYLILYSSFHAAFEAAK